MCFVWDLKKYIHMYDVTTKLLIYVQYTRYYDKVLDCSLNHETFHYSSGKDMYGMLHS